MYRAINIVSLNVPWPANYGGVIDIYYQIKALHAAGVKIILHCFEYGRSHAQELSEICDEVYYYHRHTGLVSNLTKLPYNVYSRRNKRLINNLLQNKYPVMFEGLHSCYYLNDPKLHGRIKIYREANIEHDYYEELSKAESNIFKKSFYYLEAKRFLLYQNRLRGADMMFAVSMTDRDYLRKMFPDKQVEFVPCFHGNELMVSNGSSDFILYHGNLSVKENEKAAIFLIEKVFSKLPLYRCVIAGMNPSAVLRRLASSYPNITIEANPTMERMQFLQRSAQVNVLVTFQDTGLKLKLLNSLFTGRHVIVNSKMLSGSGLEPICHVADKPEELVALCRRLMEESFTSSSLEERRNTLYPLFSDAYQAERMAKMIWGVVV